MTASTNGSKHSTLPVMMDEIQYCHDLLNAMLGDDLPIHVDEVMEIDEQTAIEMTSALNVLCWLLGHDNPQFKENMMAIEQALDDAGISFELDANK